MGKRRKRKVEKLADCYLAPALEVLASAIEADAVALIRKVRPRVKSLAPKVKTKLLDPRTINRRARRLLKRRLAMLDARS